MGCHALPQGIFPTQGLSLHLLPWCEDSSPSGPQGLPSVHSVVLGTLTQCAVSPKRGELPGPRQTVCPRDTLCELGWFGFGVLESPSEPVLAHHPEGGLEPTSDFPLQVGLPLQLMGMFQMVVKPCLQWRSYDVVDGGKQSVPATPSPIPEA